MTVTWGGGGRSHSKEDYGSVAQKGGVYSDGKRFRVFDLMLGKKNCVDDDETRRNCHELGGPTALPFRSA